MRGSAVQIESGLLASPAVSTHNSFVQTGNSVNLVTRRPMLTNPPEASLINLKSRIRHQSNRWLDYNLGAPDVRGGQNEIRWGFRSDVQLCERLDIERAEARRAAGVGPEAWVDDW